MLTDAPLFDLDTREGDHNHVHVLMPNMAYACGGNILTKRGRSRCGAWDWHLITCPECRALGRIPLHREVQRQQGHECAPDCPACQPREGD